MLLGVCGGVEGLFRAHEVTVHEDGDALTCRFYPVGKEAVSGLPEIGSGDWVAHRRAMKRR